MLNRKNLTKHVYLVLFMIFGDCACFMVMLFYVVNSIKYIKLDYFIECSIADKKTQNDEDFQSCCDMTRSNESNQLWKFARVNSCWAGFSNFSRSDEFDYWDKHQGCHEQQN